MIARIIGAALIVADPDPERRCQLSGTRGIFRDIDTPVPGLSVAVEEKANHRSKLLVSVV